MYSTLLRVKGDTVINYAGTAGISWISPWPTKTYGHPEGKEH